LREARPSLGERLARRLRSRRLVVVDRSMRPALEPGDRLRFDPGAYRRGPPEVGEIVVLEDPEGRVRWLVKRVSRVVPADRAVEVAGDAGGSARDSRTFGPVPLGAVVGRVYCRYFPPERAGEL